MIYSARNIARRKISKKLEQSFIKLFYKIKYSENRPRSQVKLISPYRVKLSNQNIKKLGKKLRKLKQDLDEQKIKNDSSGFGYSKLDL